MSDSMDLFVRGHAGYHTFRIPALAVTTPGTLLAFAEGRRKDQHDTGDIDLILRRSTDGGATFDDLRVIVSGDGDVAGNPAPVVDRDTGRVWLLFCRHNSDGAEDLIWAGQAPRTVWITSSDDDGLSWAPPRELTSAVKDPAWTWYATGPGHAIQLGSGRLLVPCDHGVSLHSVRDAADRGMPFLGRVSDPSHSHVIISDDHGETWRIGGSAQRDTNECIAVELDDGSVYLNSRSAMRGGMDANRRGFARSYDGGAGFTDVGWHDDLIDSTCQASAIRAGGPGAPLVFTNAASTSRERLTARASTDGGRTWSHGRLIHAGPAAYSDLCVLPDGKVGVLFECGDESPYERLRWTRLDVQALVPH